MSAYSISLPTTKWNQTTVNIKVSLKKEKQCPITETQKQKCKLIPLRWLQLWALWLDDRFYKLSHLWAKSIFFYHELPFWLTTQFPGFRLTQNFRTYTVIRFPAWILHAVHPWSHLLQFLFHLISLEANSPILMGTDTWGYQHGSYVHYCRVVFWEYSIGFCLGIIRLLSQHWDSWIPRNLLMCTGNNTHHHQGYVYVLIFLTIWKVATEKHKRK